MNKKFINKIRNIKNKVIPKVDSETIQNEILKKTPFNPSKIFVSGFNNKTGDGGIILFENDSLIPIFHDAGCYGLFFDNENKILFCVTRTNPQILAFHITNESSIERIPVNFENYIFANDAHGILISKNKLYVVASNGEDGSEKATNDDGPGKTVGKIIISSLIFENNSILVKNSEIYNPFNCSHHHHINDLISFKNHLFLSSFSFCTVKNEYVKRGAVSKINLGKKPEIIIDNLVHPHSLTTFDDKIYVCSSTNSQILSFDPKTAEPKLEYKGLDAFVRGLLITDNHIYFGISYSGGRTGSKFIDPITGFFSFNRKTAETKKFTIPENWDNVYSISAGSIPDN